MVPSSLIFELFFTDNNFLAIPRQSAIYHLSSFPGFSLPANFSAIYTFRVFSAFCVAPLFCSCTDSHNSLKLPCCGPQGSVLSVPGLLCLCRAAQLPQPPAYSGREVQMSLWSLLYCLLHIYQCLWLVSDQGYISPEPFWPWACPLLVVMSLRKHTEEILW